MGVFVVGFSWRNIWGKIYPAAPGNVADHVTIERQSESTIMLADGARDAYLGYVTLKVGITSNGKDYSGTGPTKIVGGGGGEGVVGGRESIQRATWPLYEVDLIAVIDNALCLWFNRSYL